MMRAASLAFGNADSSATPGNTTANTTSGTCSIAAAGTTITITNNLVTSSSRVMATVASNDVTAILKNCVPSAGSFTITLNAATTAVTKVGWLVIN